MLSATLFPMSLSIGCCLFAIFSKTSKRASLLFRRRCHSSEQLKAIFVRGLNAYIGDSKASTTFPSCSLNSAKNDVQPETSEVAIVQPGTASPWSGMHGTDLQIQEPSKLAEVAFKQNGEKNSRRSQALAAGSISYVCAASPSS